jgi:hypothetical protein
MKLILSSFVVFSFVGAQVWAAPGFHSIVSKVNKNLSKPVSYASATVAKSSADCPSPSINKNHEVVMFFDVESDTVNPGKQDN